MKKIFVSLILVAGLIVTNVHATDFKIGVVSVERILRESPQIDSLNTSLVERFGSERDELQAMEKSIIKMEQDYKRNELVMTEDKLNNLKKGIISKIQELKKVEAVLSQEVNAVKNKELLVLQKQIATIIAGIAKDKNYDLILSETSIAYVDLKHDVTSYVLDKMKSAFKNK